LALPFAIGSTTSNVITEPLPVWRSFALQFPAVDSTANNAVRDAILEAYAQAEAAAAANV
jgi:hypothetical protein